MWPFGRREARSIENPQVPISSPNIMAFLGLGEMSAAGVEVTVDSALGVPAVWAATEFLSGTLAVLPLHLYRRTPAGRERVTGGLATVLHDAVNDGMSSFDWRKFMFDQVFTLGRGVSFIERTAGNRVINLWPLDSAALTISRIDGRRAYDYRDGRRKVRYMADEVIDIAFKLRPDGLKHRSPILANKDTIGLAIALERYASRFFQNGGVPPLVLEGPFQSMESVQRASAQVIAALKAASEEKRNVLVMPPEHKLSAIGVDPEKGQLVLAQRFIIEQIARIYSLPPIFLQDLTNGTFSNSEQQDLHLSKHTITRWVEQFEQEINLKLFGRKSNVLSVEMNMDGLMRGDFTTRMQGYALAIQNSIRTPDEVRDKENLPRKGGAADKLHIQGATVPLGGQPAPGAAPAPETPPPGDDDDDRD